MVGALTPHFTDEETQVQRSKVPCKAVQSLLGRLVSREQQRAEADGISLEDLPELECAQHLAWHGGGSGGQACWGTTCSGWGDGSPERWAGSVDSAPR